MAAYIILEVQARGSYAEVGNETEPYAWRRGTMPAEEERCFLYNAPTQLTNRGKGM